MKVRISLVEKGKTGRPLTPAEKLAQEKATKASADKRRGQRRPYGVGEIVHHKKYGSGKITGHNFKDEETGEPRYSVQYDNPVQQMLGADPFVRHGELRPLKHGQRLGRDIRAYHAKQKPKVEVSDGLKDIKLASSDELMKAWREEGDSPAPAAKESAPRAKGTFPKGYFRSFRRGRTR